MLLAASLALAVEPFPSIFTRVSANGYGVLVYEGDRLTEGWTHVYEQYDLYDVTDDILYDTYFGFTDLDGTGNWLTNPTTSVVLDGTGVIESVERAGDLEFTQYAFMPMTYDGWGVVQITRVRNASETADSAPFQLTSLHNWKPGGGETVATLTPDMVVEKGSGVALWYRAPGALSNSCEDVYSTILAGKRIAGECAFYASDAVPGFGWSIPALGPGEERWVGVFTAMDATPDWPTYEESDPRSWLFAELDWWAAFHAESELPSGLSSSETAVFRQQLAWLKMAQSREAGPAFGQIPASMPVSAPVEAFPHDWNITWVRDSAYAIVALAQAGHTDEASDALRFLFQEGKAGTYSDYLSGVEYGLSVCRLYGDGTEWSDDDGTGPNIELDNWGLFLWALERTVALSGDDTLLVDLGPRALDEIADPLTQLIVPETGLVTADSSIWERHWNGYQKQFTYTSVMASVGLAAAGRMAERLGDDRAPIYAAWADAVADGVNTHLLDADGALAGNLGELSAGTGYLDIAAVEAFNFGIVDPMGPSFAPTLELWDAWLLTESGNGYLRNDDGSTYDQQEWAFADLRLAPTLRTVCASAKAQGLEDWVTEQAMQNERQIPELYDPESGAYQGPVPMLGFGAGLYILAMQERAALDGRCPPVVEPPFDNAVQAELVEGCTSAPTSPLSWAPLLAGLLWVRRRQS